MLFNWNVTFISQEKQRQNNVEFTLCSAHFWCVINVESAAIVYIVSTLQRNTNITWFQLSISDC